ncbi:MAG: large conductance mechanosensitive channel protein MscL [Anaerovoracaceae bacterium]
MKGFFKEFKEFALKGSMMDLAIGMILGAAFTSVITALVDNILNPIIGVFTGGIDFSNLFVAMNGVHYETLAQAEKAGAPVLKYGAFISALINFLIVALVLFFMVKGMNRLREKTKKEEEATAPATKTCPYCKSEIPSDAVRCPHCTSVLEETAEAPAAEAE